MKLVYLKGSSAGPKSRGPSDKLCEQFSDDPDDINVIPVGDEDSVSDIEPKIKDVADLYDEDTFLLFPKGLYEVGEPISRNAVNYGMVSYDGASGNIQIADTNIEPGYISKLPFDGKPSVLIVAANPDNEVVAYTARGHVRRGDDVHVLALTKWTGKPGWKPKMEGLYKDVVGLKKGQYTFLDIPVNKVGKYHEKLVDGIHDAMEKHNPQTIVQIGPGKNEDHNNAFLTIMDVLWQNTRTNFILADSIEKSNQKMGIIPEFNPKLWQIIDGKEIEKAMGLYELMDEPQYNVQVSNLARTLPTGVSKLLSYLDTKSRGGKKDSYLANEALESMRSGEFLLDPITLGAFGHQIVKLKIDGKTGYQIPNNTKLFGYRNLTK